MMRAKMVCNHVLQYRSDGDNPEKVTSELLKFSAVCANQFGADGSDENNTYARYTPSADMTMVVNNPALMDRIKVGATFYVDFTPAD